MTGDAGELYAELAPGLGETLASGGIPGTPWRLAVNKATGAVRVLAYASFSSALVAAPGGGTVSGSSASCVVVRSCCWGPA